MLRLLSTVAVAIGTVILCGCPTEQRPQAMLPPQAVAPALPPKAVPQSAPVQQVEVPKPEVRSDSVAELIAAVEKEYKVGVENYQAGHLAAAKQNFDRAFSLLLESPLDVHADERLQKEFDRILEGTSSMEFVALEQGDGFTEQKSEPAPIDEANEVTFPVDSNVKAKAEEEIRETRSDLPLMLTDPVVSYLNYYSKTGKGTVERALARAGRYEAMIRRILREEGVPQDLIYLAQAESGFHPLALSRAGARGMWQFMGTRAKGYGLERDWWVDERQDPEKSTRAAARHLKDLFNQFGDWYLAMAAYNSGPGTIQSAVKRTGYADFWELYRRNVLPRETRNYVPIIVAVTIMAKNRAQYGLDGITPEAPEEYDKVVINYPVDLRLVAECVENPVDKLQDLNPSLLRMTTPKDRAFELRLPTGSKEKYIAGIAAIPQDKRVWWRYHKVEPGENLATLARTYHTTSDAITEANSLESEELEPGSKVIIPIAPGKMVPGETGDLYSKRAVRYRVRKGDTVASVADNFGVPADKIRQWNRLRGNQLRTGRTLRIYPLLTTRSAKAEVAGGGRSKSHKKGQVQQAKKGRILHKVRKGETLSSIANTYNTTVETLKKDNRKESARLRPGDLLVVNANQ